MTKNWKEELVNYTDSKDHSYNCASHNEGQYCCLEKKWLESFISNLIEQVIEDASATYAYTSEQELELKQKLRDKYLN